MPVRGTVRMEGRDGTSFVPLGRSRLMGMLGKRVGQSLTSGYISHHVLRECPSAGPHLSYPLWWGREDQEACISLSD